MKYLPRLILKCSAIVLVPIAANAAGTYYTGNYQSPQQQRYTNQSYTAQRGGTFTQNGVTYNRVPQGGVGGFYNNGMPQNNQAYNRPGQMQQPSQNNAPKQQASDSKDNGFTIGGGISREYAMWRFEMKDSGSILRYDDVAWNVLGLNAAYVFDAGNLKLRLDAGFKYGFQSGEANMIDDDITNGGYFITQWVEPAGNNTYDILGDQIGYALSVGTSDGGSMMGFNVGFGMADLFKLGNVKFSPSIGYRYMKYKLETNKNYGMAVDRSACYYTTKDEIQCDPIVIFIDSAGNTSVVWGLEEDQEYPSVPNGSVAYDTQGTYYFEQPGTSHSYEVEWSGPYVALDVDYAINPNNAVNGRIELGFPGYTSTGDQPYRPDWAHPKSVDDKADMFSAFHLGLGAQWLTAITDNVSLSLGVTYDYYTVSGADATTYLNSAWYEEIYDKRLSIWESAGKTEAEMLDPKTGDAVALNIVDLLDSCPGWVCKAGGEIDSFYKSLGVRLGLVAKF